MSADTTGGRYLLKTLGCKANLYDSQLLESELQKKGWLAADLKSGADADLCIINSCTVTDEADKQSRKLATRLLKDHPRAKVVITGCAAEVDPELMAETPGIHYVVGNRDKPDLVNLVLASISGKVESGILGRAANYDEMLSRHPIDREWATPEAAFMVPPARHRGEAGRTRTFLKIQEGCNSFCTYCVIPYGRGPSRSLGISEIVSQVNELVGQGVQEVVITGTNVGDYGIDWNSKPAVTELFEAIFAETDLPRLRVSSLDPTEITPELFALMRREPRFQPHFHVSLQSPHSKILKLMKRTVVSQPISFLTNSQHKCRRCLLPNLACNGQNNPKCSGQLCLNTNAPMIRSGCFPSDEAGTESRSYAMWRASSTL